jgi:hypothetical protein
MEVVLVEREVDVTLLLLIIMPDQLKNLVLNICKNIIKEEENLEGIMRVR